MPVSALTQVRRANRSVSRLYNLVLSSCGLRATQYLLLQTIASANEIPQHELARGLSISSAALSRRLSGLKKRGWVKSRLATHGSRVYAITAAGKKLLSCTSQQWESAELRLRSVLGEADWQLFLDICDRVCEATKQAETIRLAICRPRKGNLMVL